MADIDSEGFGIVPTTAFERGVYVEYDFQARFLGQRYLLDSKHDGPGYVCIPVAD